jgi:DNA ligase-associated metallophosphoesterase
MQINLAGTTVQLLPQKALFLPEQGMLVLGDLHLGKAMHFRKSGIFMPQASAARDYHILHNLIQQYQPEAVYFLGDLFHSLHNSEWLQFEKLITTYPDIRFTLVRGNHDVLDQTYYERLQIAIIPHAFLLGNLIFSHKPLAEVPEGSINIAGHIHPGCMVRGLGRQSIKLPCFYLKGQTFLLPAFGQLTGLHILEQNADTTIFAILPERVVLV